MKTKILFTFLLAVILLNVKAQINSNNIIVGNVYNISTFAPIVGHKVYCTDSLTYNDSTITGTSGQFYFPIGNVSSPNLNYYVYTFDCNNIVSYNTIKSIDTANFNVYFNICDYSSAFCQASFTMDSVGYMTYSFINNSIGNPITTDWDFGDGTTSNVYSPTHTFLYPGQHLIHLMITTALGCVNNSYAWLNVLPGGSCNVTFSYNNISPDTIQFQNSSSSSYIYSKIKYLWNFGDGSTDTLENPLHVFALFPNNNGYNVCLKMSTFDTIYNSLICQDSFCYFVTINSPEICDNSFTYTLLNHIYTFTGLNTSTYPTTYYWDFGDTTTAVGNLVNHVYTQPLHGLKHYNACLNTTTHYPNSDSCNFKTCHDVYVISNDPIIYGYIRAGDFNADNGIVVRYGINNPSGTLSIIDTAVFTDGFYAFHAPTANYPAFMLKAFLNSTSNYFNSYLPTYYDTIIKWVYSPPVYPTTDGFKYDIGLVPYGSVVTTGNGLISGTVINGNTNSAIDGVEVILFDQNENPLNYQYTKNGGVYIFDHLDYGTYKIYIEIPGKKAEEIIVVLSQSNPHVVNLNFTVRDKTITSISDDIAINKSIVGDVYPNPAKEEASIDFSILKSTKVKLIVLNNLGQTCYNEDIKLTAGYHKHTINTQQLEAGFYTIQITTSEGIRMVKKFVISK